MVFTEGWPLYPSRRQPGAHASTTARRPAIRSGTDPRPAACAKPGAQIRRPGMQTVRSLRAACARCWPTAITRSEFRELLQRANRANVSFYPIDARGLIVFDTPIELGVPPSVDAAWLRKRHDDLRMMAMQTDGEAVLDMQRRVAGDAEDLRRRRLVLPAELLLDQSEARRPLPPHSRRGEARRTSRCARGPAISRRPKRKRARPAATDHARRRASRAAADRDARARCPRARARQSAGARPGRRRRAARSAPSSSSMPPPRSSPSGCRAARCGSRSSRSAPPAPARPPSSQTMTLAIEPGQRSILIDGSERAARRRPLFGSRRAHAAQRPPADPGDDVRHGACGCRGGRHRRAGAAARPEHRTRVRADRRSALPPHRAAAHRSAAGRRGLHGRGPPADARRAAAAAGGELQRAHRRERDSSLASPKSTLAPLAAGEYVLELSLTKDGKTEAVNYGFRIIP